jgi:hypothetical protein
MLTQPAKSSEWACPHCKNIVPAAYAHKCLEYDRAMTSVSDNLLERVRDYIYDCTKDECNVGWTLSKYQAEDLIAMVRAEASNDLVGEMDWLASNTNLELTWGELGGDMSDCAWRVHRVNGGYNDREWTLIATGETPIAAIKQARMRDARGGGAVVQENSGRTQIGEWPEE